LQAVAERRRARVPGISQLPPKGSRPLTVAGRVAGWATANATDALHGLPGVHIEDEGVHITASRAPRVPVNGVLARAAKALDDAGCVRSWRNELLDVVAEGRRVAVLERGAMRPLGMLTTAVHLNAWTPDGKLWIARRALTKSTDPGKWDTLVGGLVGAAEPLDTALLRESEEEAGLVPADLAGRSELRRVGRMHRRLPEGYQVEDLWLSECVLASSVRLANQDGEVSEICSVGVDDVWSLVMADEFTVEAELTLLDTLRAHLADAS
jgi:8-oxo-dGTP pyrophosphatase MutT (NUDIX family)